MNVTSTPARLAYSWPSRAASTPNTSWLHAAGPCRIIAAERRARDRDARHVDIVAHLEPVDALAHGHFIIVPGGEAVAAESRSLSRPIHQKHRYAALQRAATGHEPQF